MFGCCLQEVKIISVPLDTSSILFFSPKLNKCVRRHKEEQGHIDMKGQ